MSVASLLARATVVAGLCWAAFAVTALVSTPEEGTRVVLDRTSEWVGHSVFAIALALTVAALAALHLHQRGADGRLGRAGALVAMAGCAAQCVVIGTIVVTGEEPSWFGIVAPLAILTWVLGSVALGVAARRAGVLPRWVGTLLPPATILAIVGSENGTSLLIAAFLLVVGLRLEHAAIAIPRPALTVN